MFDLLADLFDSLLLRFGQAGIGREFFQFREGGRVIGDPQGHDGSIGAGFHCRGAGSAGVAQFRHIHWHRLRGRCFRTRVGLAAS